MPIYIPPLREADTPRKYKLQPRPEVGLEAIVRRLERAISQPDIRRQRFPNVGEEQAQKIRR